MDQHLSTARYARENTVSQRSVRATCLLFEESEALLHRHLCLEQGVSKSPVRPGDDRRVVRRAARGDHLALKRVLKHTLHDGEERGSLLRREVVLFAKEQIVETEIDEDGAARVVLIMPNTHRGGERAVDRRGTSAFVQQHAVGNEPPFAHLIFAEASCVSMIAFKTSALRPSIIGRAWSLERAGPPNRDSARVVTGPEMCRIATVSWRPEGSVLRRTRAGKRVTQAARSLRSAGWRRRVMLMGAFL